MQLRKVHILCSTENAAEKAEAAIKDCDEILDMWSQQNQDSQSFYMIVAEHQQDLMDSLKTIAEEDKSIRVIITPIEATFPKNFKEEQQEDDENNPGFFEIISREEMVEKVRGQAHLSGSYISLIIISAIVATIALVEGNLAILIGAMVITPLIGPNLSLALGTAIANGKLIKSSLLTGFSGAALTFLTAFITGLLMGSDANKHLAKTLIDYGFESLPVAACAGVAAAILLLQGTVSTLIGVMVAVAFLPPIAMTGLSLATGHYPQSLDAAMLFAINLAAFNLAAKSVLFLAGIRPHRTEDDENHGRTIIWYILGWAIAILALAIGLYLKSGNT